VGACAMATGATDAAATKPRARRHKRDDVIFHLPRYVDREALVGFVLPHARARGGRIQDRRAAVLGAT
jgi:hypothetical protein